MVASFGHRLLVKLFEVLSEFVLVSSDELCVLLAIQKETELRDRTDVVGLSGITTVVAIYGAKDNVLVLVSTSGTLVHGLESHAGATGCRPEIDNHRLGILDNFGEVGLILDVADFTHDRGLVGI